MITPVLWTLIAVQVAMGGFDTLVHHEVTERLAWRPSQRRELLLHGTRNLIYAVLFLMLGWAEPHGLGAHIVIALLVIEVVITLADFVEEDMSRKLPPSERINHTLLALNYGAILVLLVPVLIDWSRRATGIAATSHGIWSAMATSAAIGVALFGLRDLFAMGRVERLILSPARSLAQGLELGTRVLVTGATGFIGSRLCAALAAAGHEVIALTRDARHAEALTPPYRLVTSLDAIAADTRIDAIVNLAGAPIASRPWTRASRETLIASRVETTRALAALVGRLAIPPAVLVNGSAIGWYGLRGDEALDETAALGAGFSHELCAAWEAEAAAIAARGVRTVLLRIGLVLGTEAGMLARLLTPFEFGLGGRIGDGRQWMSWIERDDLVRLIVFAIATPTLEGPVNATAPEPVRNAAFTATLARALGRPALLPVPAAPLRLLAGDFARELLLGGQRVVPAKALAAGFAFRHEKLAPTFDAMLGNEGDGDGADRGSRFPRTPATVRSGSPVNAPIEKRIPPLARERVLRTLERRFTSDLALRSALSVPHTTRSPSAAWPVPPTAPPCRTTASFFPTVAIGGYDFIARLTRNDMNVSI